MNTQLVESLAQIIKALTPEEKGLLEEKIKSEARQQTTQSLGEVREEIDVSDLIYQMREERTQQLMDACFPELSHS